jgi:hypothetical protein
MRAGCTARISAETTWEECAMSQPMTASRLRIGRMGRELMIEALNNIEPIGICVAGFFGLSMASYAVRLVLLQLVRKGVQ